MGSPIQEFSSEVVLEGELEDALFAGTENLAGRAVIKVIVNFPSRPMRTLIGVTLQTKIGPATSSSRFPSRFSKR
jgi:hypothetical protein